MRWRGGAHFDAKQQAVLEFVAATTRPRSDLNGAPLLSPVDAYREAEGLMRDFPILYPDEAVLSSALRGVATYRLSWFDAHLWAYAEVNGLPEILTEHFELVLAVSAGAADLGAERAIAHQQ